jgi:hypothetical protein
MKRIRFVQQKLCKRMECGESWVGAGCCRERGRRCVFERPRAQKSWRNMKRICFLQRKLCKHMECGESRVGAGRCRESGRRCQESERCCRFESPQGYKS